MLRLFFIFSVIDLYIPWTSSLAQFTFWGKKNFGGKNFTALVFWTVEFLDGGIRQHFYKHLNALKTARIELKVETILTQALTDSNTGDIFIAFFDFCQNFAQRKIRKTRKIPETTTPISPLDARVRFKMAEFGSVFSNVRKTSTIFAENHLKKDVNVSFCMSKKT